MEVCPCSRLYSLPSESMRSIVTEIVGPNPPGRRAERTKYIFAFEGFRTEVSYFEGIANNRAIAGIKDLVDICVLQREDIDSGCSDPLVLLDILDQNIRSMEEGRHNIQTLSEILKNEACKVAGWNRSDTEAIQYGEELKSRLARYADERGTIIDLVGAIGDCEEFTKSQFGVTFDPDVPEPEIYNPDTDHVCVLIDRDRGAHTPQVIDEFVSECKKRGYEPYICNPCFEFWLLLHFEDVCQIDRGELNQNEMIGERRFTEVKLDEVLNGLNPLNHYDKTRLDPLMFIHRIPEAVRNNAAYCREVKCLKHEVGTNLGPLFERMCNL